MEGDDDVGFHDPLSEDGLRQYLGTDDLQSVRFLEMRVESREVPLELLGERLPNLRELKLSGSHIESIRNL